ncbi:MAG: hypothetical protein Q9217_004457 [Psora testacea]
MAKSQQAYQRGDGAAAHALSEEGKRHEAMMERYNKQASEYIFRANNSIDRVAGDTIDLHGQFVEEAEDILEQRIRYARSTGQTHLHVIVGKGNHSPGHIQKIKPRVEQICRAEGLQFATEDNAGRIYINLHGGQAIIPEHLRAHNGGGYHQGYGGHQGQQYHGGQGQYHQQQQHHPHQQEYGHQQHNSGYPGGYQQQQHHHGGQQHQDQIAEVEAPVKSDIPRVLRQCVRMCCTVM